MRTKLKTPNFHRPGDLQGEEKMQQRLFKQVLEASGVAMSIRDKDLRPVYANHAFLEFYGYTLRELQEKSLDEILVEQTRLLYAEVIIPTINSGKSWEGEYTIRTKAGRLCAIWGRIDPVFDDNGRLIHVITVMRDASASMRLRNALTQTERHLKFLSENTSDCLFRLRLTDGRYDYISSAIESITGYPPQDFYQTPRLFERLTPADWIETFEMWWGEFLAGKSRYEYEQPLRHKDGSFRWVNQRITVVKDEGSSPIAIEGIITDVTERHAVQEDLASTRESLHFISSSTSDIFFRIRVPDGLYEYISPSVEQFSGYTAEEFMEDGSLIFRIIHPDWQEYARQCWNEHHDDRIRSEYEYQFIHKSGAVRWVRQRIVLIRDGKGKTIAIEGIATDVTEAKAAEQALKASEKKYRLLVENISDVVWTQNTAGEFTYATPSAEALWGYTPEELKRLDYKKLFTHQSWQALLLSNRQRHKAEKQGQFSDTNINVYEHVRKDRSLVWAETVIRRTFTANGKPSGYLGVSRDITERKWAEDAMRRSESRFRTLFEDSPISLWEEDLTRLKAYFDKLKLQGISDFRSYFHENPESLGTCASLVEVVAVNKATLELLRADSQAELMGNLDKILTERSMAAFAEEMILLASGGCEYSGEITHRTLEGKIIWVVVHFTVPPEYQGSLSRVIVSLIDVTPRKRAEQALMESEERYRVLVENAQEGVVVALNDKPMFANDALSEILGYSYEELMLLSPFEVAHPEDKTHAMQQMAEYSSGLREEGFATLRVITKQGEIKWITLSIKPIRWGGKNAELKIITDISHYKALEQELRVAHAEMEARVRQRTAELSQTNLKLTREVEERQKAQDQILSLTRQIIRVQEDERQRISRDLHDNVAQDLSSIVLNMETLFDGAPAVAAKVIRRSDAVTDIIRGAIAAVRDIAYGLRPPALDQLGLPLALERHCEEVSGRTRVDIDFFSTGIENTKLDFDTEINIYRMVQEALSNMGKHSNATRSTVRLVTSYPNLLIRIEDNGDGFPVARRVAEAAKERRMGLRSMEERAKLIGGSMELQSRIGTGTRVIFTIPITSARR